MPVLADRLGASQAAPLRTLTRGALNLMLMDYGRPEKPPCEAGRPIPTAMAGPDGAIGSRRPRPWPRSQVLVAVLAVQGYRPDGEPDAADLERKRRLDDLAVDRMVVLEEHPAGAEVLALHRLLEGRHRRDAGIERRRPLDPMTAALASEQGGDGGARAGSRARRDEAGSD